VPANLLPGGVLEELVFTPRSADRWILPSSKAHDRRRLSSCRDFSNERLPWDLVLSVISTAFLNGAGSSQRSYASAGGVFSVEVFLLLLSSRIESGPTSNIGHLLATERCVEPFGTVDEEELMTILNGNGVLDPAATGHYHGRPNFVILYTILLDRALAKYRHRGYRFALMEDEGRPIPDPYVFIAVQSSTWRKNLTNPEGWHAVVAFLKSHGYRVICIDQKHVYGTGIVWNHIPHGAEDQTGDRPLEERARWIKHAEFFIGLSSGLSWLAWAVGTPVVMISGFTHPTNEFYTP
jgi:hypothetical protein